MLNIYRYIYMYIYIYLYYILYILYILYITTYIMYEKTKKQDESLLFDCQCYLCITHYYRSTRLSRWSGFAKRNAFTFGSFDTKNQ